MNWFIYHGGKTIGPITTDKLRELIKSGKIPPETQIKRDVWQVTLPASRVALLLQNSINQDTKSSPFSSVTPYHSLQNPLQTNKPEISNTFLIGVICFSAFIPIFSTIVCCGGILYQPKRPVGEKREPSREEQQRILDELAAKREKEDKSNSKAARPKEKTPPTDTWYVGGTLHRASMEKWGKAGYSDKLATAADFMLVFLKADGVKIDNIDLDNDLKPLAQTLVREMDRANAGGVMNNQNASEVAALVFMLTK